MGSLKTGRELRDQVEIRGHALLSEWISGKAPLTLQALVESAYIQGVRDAAKHSSIARLRSVAGELEKEFALGA